MRIGIIIILGALLVWFGSIIVELENYKYASMLGFCSEIQLPHMRHECLLNTETRTHWIGHLIYALGLM